MCLCQGGHRADQPVLERSRTEELIRQYVDSQYVSSDPRSPGGTCQDCRCRLADWAGGKKANPRPLFIAAGVDLGVVAEGGKCHCYFCTVSALNGGAWNSWKKKAAARKKEQGAKIDTEMRRCGACLTLIRRGPGHSLEVCRSDLTKMRNIEASCSMDLRMKMALNTLKEVVGASGDCVLKLPCHSGGQHMTVHLGKLPGYSLSPMPTFTIDECIRMKIQADLTDRQLYVILKNLRSECLAKVFI